MKAILSIIALSLAYCAGYLTCGFFRIVSIEPAVPPEAIMPLWWQQAVRDHDRHTYHLREPLPIERCAVPACVIAVKNALHDPLIAYGLAEKIALLERAR